MNPTAELLQSYKELNVSSIDVFDEEPSPLEFMRYVARNRPFVIRGGASKWKATRNWNAAYLKEALKDEQVNVAITPYGNADSPTLHGDGKLMFVKPLEEEQSFPEFLDYLINQELTTSNGEVRYAQTQNDNLRGEYASIFCDVEKDVAWARIALQQKPDAINMWIGNSRSVTALHKDNYENIYCQIIGTKHFVLLPPLAFPGIKEQILQSASYERQDDGTLKMREEDDYVPFATWDPDTPAEMATEYSHLCEPIRVDLKAGDMMYLPAMWYHKVSQSCSEGLCCAVNYWYDMDFTGSFYPLCSYVRNSTLAPNEGITSGESNMERNLDRIDFFAPEKYY